jgi:hypothetical protein
MEEAEDYEGWSRLWDENQQHWYWYNEYTQESRWEEVGNDNDADAEDVAHGQVVHKEPAQTEWNSVQSQWKQLGMVSKDTKKVGNNATEDDQENNYRTQNDEYQSTSDEDENDDESFNHQNRKLISAEKQPTLKNSNKTAPIRSSGSLKKSKKQLRYKQILNDTTDAVSW